MAISLLRAGEKRNTGRSAPPLCFLLLGVGAGVGVACSAQLVFSRYSRCKALSRVMRVI